MRWLRMLRGALGLGLSWAVLWAVFGLTLGYIIMQIDPTQIDPGEEPIVIARILGTVGFVSGSVFAAVLAFAERQRKVRDLSLWRVAFWGALAGAALPLLTPMNDVIVFNTAPLAAMSAALTVALARRADRRAPLPSLTTDPV